MKLEKPIVEKPIVVGISWGIISGLLFFLFPEGFNIYHTQSMTWTFIPNWIKVLALLPIYAVLTIGNFTIPYSSFGSEPEAIFIIAPIYIILSGVIGGVIGYLYTLRKLT